MMIEANTEELREILQAVYDLPDANSGGSGYDAVITVGGHFFSNDNFELTYDFDDAEILNTTNKLLNGELASVILRCTYEMWSGQEQYGFSLPTLVTINSYDAGTYTYKGLHVAFYLQDVSVGYHKKVILFFENSANNPESFTLTTRIHELE